MPVSAFAHPGGWNDPDHILIGTVGDALNDEAPARITSLSPDEQYNYMSLWSLMAAPLFFSGDMNRLDAFTLNVLCNSEVIDIDQDSLGEQARIVRETPQDVVLAKKLEDGSVAIGLFNLSDTPREVLVSWQEMGISGPQQVRDVWRQRNIGSARDFYSSRINRHGVMLVRLTPMPGKQRQRF